MKLLIRADASAEIGTGHVMRCLALAQAWQDLGGTVGILTAAGDPRLVQRLQTEGVEVRPVQHEPGSLDDASRTADLARDWDAAWIVLDGYLFGGDFQRSIKDSGVSLLALDDFGHAEHYAADLVLNQNPSATEAFYASREPYTQLLLGTEYVLLRREFRLHPPLARAHPPVAREVLVTLGGGDAENVTGRVLDALSAIAMPGIRARVAVGATNPHLHAIRRRAAQLAHPVEIIENPADMAGLMQSADLAVAGAGSTCWELAFMGVPALVVVQAENQQPIADFVDAEGIAVSLGREPAVTADGIAEALRSVATDPARRAAMSYRAQRLVDGLGAMRVCQAMFNR